MLNAACNDVEGEKDGLMWRIDQCVPGTIFIYCDQYYCKVDKLFQNRAEHRRQFGRFAHVNNEISRYQNACLFDDSRSYLMRQENALYFEKGCIVEVIYSPIC